MVCLFSPRFPATEVASALGGPVTLLGRGAFGDTWHHADTAVKIICDDGYPEERVRREVDGLTRVKSQHVVQLLDTTSVFLGGRDRPALIFEYVSGGDIAHRIDSGHWPTEAESLALLHGLLVAVRDMHATQTVHRDIKPGNIALRDGDWSRPVLLDLGLARGLTEKTITVYPGHIGTALYMAPEQLQGRRARKAADLFAIGVTLRQLLTQRHPFYENGKPYSIDEALARIVAGPHPLPVSISTNFTAILDRLVSATENNRGSANSNLKRLHDAGGRST